MLRCSRSKSHLVDRLRKRVEDAKALKELLKEVDEVLDVLDAGHLADPGRGEAVSEMRRRRSRWTHECMLRMGAPMSTVRRPILETSGPTVRDEGQHSIEVKREDGRSALVDPQAMSFRTKYS